jgi:hypothetical protein
VGALDSVISELLSRWRWRCSQSRDKPQDIGEQLSRHRDLGHLESDIAPMADDLGADLDEFLAQAGQLHEVAEVVGERVKLKADGVGGERAARQPRPFDRADRYDDRPRHLHSANLWIELHGERAIAEARIMAAEMRAKGDVEGADTWLQIIVIEEMRRNGKLAGRTYLAVPHESLFVCDH